MLSAWLRELSDYMLTKIEIQRESCDSRMIFAEFGGMKMDIVATRSLCIYLSAMVLAASLLVGCVANTPYRTTAGPCSTPNCEIGSIEDHPVTADPSISYLLGIVEFDDQGAKHIPAQMDALFTRLEAESADQDLCITVFVHGWEHNAAFHDTNVDEFRALLETLALTEREHGTALHGKPRKAVGIYASWRGKSIDGDLFPLTFWGRKDAAERVAKGSVRELLGRARALRDTLNRKTWSGKLLQAGAPLPRGEMLRSTRLLTIGHSFGGLIVYSALAQYYTDRAAAAMMSTALGDARDEDKAISAYGDLVVIVNPAVEAMSWEPIRQIVEGRTATAFSRGQKPVFVEVTSTADNATGIAFPLGRSVSTMGESFTNGDELAEARTAFGHYERFLTHDLTSRPEAATPEWQAVSPDRLKLDTPQQAADAFKSLVHSECMARAKFEEKWRRDGYLQPGWTRQFSAGAVLSHRKESGKEGAFDPNDPFWIVSADASVISSHSDISRPVFVDFVRQLYDDLLPDDAVCKTERAGRRTATEAHRQLQVVNDRVNSRVRQRE
jgi:hypothetical protein